MEESVVRSDYQRALTGELEEDLSGAWQTGPGSQLQMSYLISQGG